MFFFCFFQKKIFSIASRSFNCDNTKHNNEIERLVDTRNMSEKLLFLIIKSDSWLVFFFAWSYLFQNTEEKAFGFRCS